MSVCYPVAAGGSGQNAPARWTRCVWGRHMRVAGDFERCRKVVEGGNWGDGPSGHSGEPQHDFSPLHLKLKRPSYIPGLCLALTEERRVYVGNAPDVT